MGIFCYKKINARANLCEQFSAARTTRGWTLAELSARTRTPEKYVRAIEDGAYHLLPSSRPYRTAYIRELCDALELEARSALKQFYREGGLAGVAEAHPRTGIRFSRFASVSILARNIALGLAGVLFIAYLGLQVRGVLEPPALNVFAPLEGDTSNDQTIFVQGNTNPETQLSINGQPVVVTKTGDFETKIDAAVGLDTITISATKKHGKTTTVTRHVVVRAKPLPKTLSVE